MPTFHFSDFTVQSKSQYMPSQKKDPANMGPVWCETKYKDTREYWKHFSMILFFTDFVFSFEMFVLLEHKILEKYFLVIQLLEFKQENAGNFSLFLY